MPLQRKYGITKEMDNKNFEKLISKKQQQLENINVKRKQSLQNKVIKNLEMTCNQISTPLPWIHLAHFQTGSFTPIKI